MNTAYKGQVQLLLDVLPIVAPDPSGRLEPVPIASGFLPLKPKRAHLSVSPCFVWLRLLGSNQRPND